MPEDASAPAPKRRWLPALGLAVIAVVAGVGWFFLKEVRTPAPSAATATPAPAVGVRLVVQKGVSESFEFVGHIKAVDKVDIRARVEGFLEKRLFREGQFVKTGDLLYQIEKVQYEALVEQAKANLASAEAESTNAKLQYTRQLELSKKQFSPQSVVDQDQAAMDTAAAKIMQAKAALRQAAVNLETAASGKPSTPSATWSIRRAASWRPSSDRIRSTCCFLSACATSKRSARRGARKAAG